MGVVVYRELGDRPGDDINSEVLVNAELQRERGRQAINETDSDRIRLSGSAINVGFMAPGSIVSVTDVDGVKNGYLEDYAKTVEIGSGSYSAIASVSIEQVK